jgi:hypothetical protein
MMEWKYISNHRRTQENFEAWENKLSVQILGLPAGSPGGCPSNMYARFAYVSSLYGMLDLILQNNGTPPRA